VSAYFNALSAGFSAQAGMIAALDMRRSGLSGAFSAAARMCARVGQDYPKPAFGIDSVFVGGKETAVTAEAVMKKDFGTLLRFRRDMAREDPKVLIAAPMSGHYASQLRETVRALLSAHDVYVTDWENARDVPLAKGDFGLGDYVGYLRDFIAAAGAGTHVIGISQSTVPLLAAVSLMAQDNAPNQPPSMTLLCGPVDPRAAETAVSRFGQGKPRAWFEGMTARVPENHAGAGRTVYPGFVQLMNLLSVDPAAHLESHAALFGHLSRGEEASAREIERFYDDYFAVSDLTGKFFIETIERVFQRAEIATGGMTIGGGKVDPSAITRTALLTVEGGRDIITAPGQTAAAHRLCAGLAPGQHDHFLHKDANHYSLAMGAHWKKDVLPRVAAHIARAA
jgi:polyhydroxyalkanoate depolymerase